MTSLDISIVIPIFNEQKSLELLIERTLKVLETLGRTYELILIDDGSSDGSADMISQFAQSKDHVVGIILNKNYGQHAAIRAGFSQARGTFVITLDGDLQNPPEEIPRIIEKMDEGFDVVGTIRSNRKDTLFRKLASQIVNKAVRRSTGVMMHDYGCMLRGYHKNVVRAMLACQEKTTFIPILANSFSRKATEINVEHAHREIGDSKYNLIKLITLQFDLLTTMTTFPIRVLSYVGGIMAFLGVGLGLFLFCARIFFGAEWAVQGVFTLFAVLFFFLGAQFFGLGLLGEYIGRIFHQTQGRPSFFIHEIIEKNVVERNPNHNFFRGAL